MSELREQMKAIKPLEAAQVIAQATGQRRKRQVKLFLIGALVAIAVFMALAAKFMKSPRRPNPASLGVASSGAAPMPTALSAASPSKMPGAGTATPHPGQDPSTAAAQVPGAAQLNSATPAMPGVVPGASQSASGTAATPAPAEQPVQSPITTPLAASAATHTPEAPAKPQTQASSPKAAATRSVGVHHTMARRQAPPRTAVKHLESRYDRIGISED